jgi:outer membrane protein OmpA-like peptidoglycan-associated protein
MYFYDAAGKEVISMEFDNRVNYHLGWNYSSTSDERVGGDAPKPVVNFDGWHHFAVSFNKRAFKIYLDGIRLANIPNMKQPASFMYCDFPMNSSSGGALTNVRIAKGAVPLYDRMMTDGKIITYGITFDVGKSTIKPESMGEINRIAKLMTDNPDLKFSVEGHTDTTGSAAANQTLSDARSKAVVDKLIQTGIAADRLKSDGKGQTSPIADNATDEGRAKNRRVEFVKI